MQDIWPAVAAGRTSDEWPATRRACLSVGPRLQVMRSGRGSSSAACRMAVEMQMETETETETRPTDWTGWSGPEGVVKLPNREETINMGGIRDTERLARYQARYGEFY